MKPLPLKQIQNLIAQNLPSDMSYARNRVKIGKGKKKRTQLKVAGASDDKMFFIMCYDSPVTRMEFMVPSIPEYLSRTVAILKVILLSFFPEWTGGEWLTEIAKTIDDNQKIEKDYGEFKITVSRLDVYNQKIIMLDIS